jgi:hypothetical protein
MNNVTKQVACIVIGVTLLAILATVGNIAQSTGVGGTAPFGNERFINHAPPKREPKPEIVKDDTGKWEDYPEDYFRNVDRAATRPGNFELLGLVSAFFDGCYQIRPEFKEIAYPFRHNQTVVQDEAEAVKLFAALEGEPRHGSAMKNALRKYNVNVFNVEFITLEDGETAISNPVDRGVSLAATDRFADVRKVHPGRCVLTVARIRLESREYRNPKEEHDREMTVILGWVRPDDAWKLVWVDN